MHMKKENLVLLIFVATMSLLAGGCENKGPIEKAGERADEIVDNAQDGDPLLHRKGPVEKLGEKIDDSVSK